MLRRERTLRFLTAQEIERVLAAAPDKDAPASERDCWPVVRLTVLTATYTGMRVGELAALRWSDLDTGALKIRVRRSYVRGRYGAPKSRSGERAIPLSSRLLSELDAHHRQGAYNQDCDLVLCHPHTGRPMPHNRLMWCFRRALERADVRPVRIHTSGAHVRYSRGGLRAGVAADAARVAWARRHPDYFDLR